MKMSKSLQSTNELASSFGI